MLNQSNTIGLIGEQAFSLEAIKQDWHVLKPVSDKEAYDFVITKDHVRFIKVQVKTAKQSQLEGKHCAEKYQWSVCRRVNNIKVSYEDNDIDVFALYAIEEDAWFIIPTYFIESKTVSIPVEVVKNIGNASKYKGFRNAWDMLSLC
tara:strand:+ start:110 stop:547 length:438 start_codon:yes stop_codon:yes gene_type:complete